MKRPYPILMKIAETMQQEGGSFAETLGLAMRLADEINLRRIEAAFPELMNEYAERAGVE